MFRSLRDAKKNARAVEQYAAEVAALQGKINQKNADIEAAIEAATEKADRLAAKTAENLRLALDIPSDDILDLRRRYAEVVERNDRQAALLADLAAQLDVAVLALKPGPPSSVNTVKDGK